MQNVEIASLLPTLRDLIVPAIIGAALWGAKKILPIVSGTLLGFGKKWVASDLKKIRNIRRCPFAIQRQLAKEGALFNAFLTITVIMLGALMLLSRQLQFVQQLIYFSVCMAPVLVLEWWWLVVRGFNEQLLQESIRLSPTFKRVVAHRKQSDRRSQARAARQVAIERSKTLKTASVRLVARRLV